MFIAPSSVFLPGGLHGQRYSRWGHKELDITVMKAEHQRIDVCFFFNFYFYFILLYNTVLVLPYIDMLLNCGLGEDS